LKNKKEGRTTSIWLLGIFWILMLTCFLALSRLIAGTFVSCWILLALSPIQDRSVIFLKKFFRSASVVMLPIVVIVSIWVLMPVRFHFETQGVDRRFEVQWNHSKADYWLLGRAAMDMFNEHPLFGVGFNNYTIRLKEYMGRYQLDPYNIYSTPRGKMRCIPHQVILGWMAQTGIVGLLAFLLFFSLYFKKLWAALNRYPRSMELIGFWALSMGWLIQGLLSDFMYTRILWIILAMGLSVAESLNRDSRS
jgi:O-antigen ligase